MPSACYLWIIVLITLFSSCKNGNPERSGNDTATINGHPAWIMQGNIYEVNVRQYTPEGSFKAFEQHLDRLKEMGVQTLWFMPVQPISKVDRKGTLGSYYAIADYNAINPEYGTMDDWKALVQKAHALGFKVIIDWVANHTGGDHYWLEKYPGFFVRDSVTGKPVSQFDWTDTRKLNFNNPVLKDSMIASMKWWLHETGIDGFRCDVAGEVPDAFWQTCIAALKKEKPGIFMLAEGDKPGLHTVGFDATYTWQDFGMLKQIASGKRNVNDYDSVLAQTDINFPANAIRLYFTSNHDENSWNKADFETMPGPSHAPFAVLTQTMKRGVPLVYSGQEEPVLRAVSFFEKDTMRFEKLARGVFYRKLAQLRKNNPALAANAAFVKLKTDKDNAIYAYYRKAGEHFVMVLLNLTGTTQKITLNDPALQDIQGAAVVDVFQGGSLKNIPTGALTLKPWEYRVMSSTNGR